MLLFFATEDYIVLALEWKLSEKTTLWYHRWIRSHSVWLKKYHIIRLVKNILYYVLVVFVVTLCLGSLLNVQFQPGNRRRRSLCTRRQPTVLQIWLYYTSRTISLTCCVRVYYVGTYNPNEYLKYRRRQRQRYLPRAVLCYFMSVSNKPFDLFTSIILSSQNNVTTIFTVKLKKVTSLSLWKTFLKVNSNEKKLHLWVMHWI